MVEVTTDEMPLHLWCDSVVRSPFGWRLEKKNLRHCVITTYSKCPDDEVLSCPVKSCLGVCRTRPKSNPSSSGKPTKKKARKKRAAKKKA